MSDIPVIDIAPFRFGARQISEKTLLGPL